LIRRYSISSSSTSQQLINYIEARAKVSRVGWQILDSSFSDDGMLTSEDPAEVEHFKGLYTVGFARVGVNMKSNETSPMIMNEDEFLEFIGPRKWTHRIANKDGRKCGASAAERT
jgi:hypothetical protein